MRGRDRAGAKDRVEAGDEREGPVSHWARLKSEARGDLPAPAEAADPMEAEGAPAVPDGAAADPAEAVEAVRVEDLPDVETLDYDSDFSAFMQNGVPEELQRLALRKLWRSNPVLANVDGLNDYDLDYKKLGDDGRVTAALLAQRKAKEGVLRGAEAAEPAGKAEPPAQEARDASPSPVAERPELAAEAAEAAEQPAEAGPDDTTDKTGQKV